MGVALTAVEGGGGVTLGSRVQRILTQVQPILKSNAGYTANENAPHARCIAVRLGRGCINWKHELRREYHQLTL